MNVLLIDGHPDPESLCAALAHAYARGARDAGHHVERLAVRDLAFSPNLAAGYRARTELEAPLLAAQGAITRAQHLAVVYPTWWGGLPGVLKGFVDRVFLPGFAFRSVAGQRRPQGLLAGRSARLLVTMDAPAWWDRLTTGASSRRAMQSATLGFCGVRPVRTTVLDNIRERDATQRARLLETARALGSRAHLELPRRAPALAPAQDPPDVG